MRAQSVTTELGNVHELMESMRGELQRLRLDHDALREEDEAIRHCLLCAGVVDEQAYQSELVDRRRHGGPCPLSRADGIHKGRENCDPARLVKSTRVGCRGSSPLPIRPLEQSATAISLSRGRSPTAEPVFGALYTPSVGAEATIPSSSPAQPPDRNTYHQAGVFELAQCGDRAPGISSLPAAWPDIPESLPAPPAGLMAPPSSGGPNELGHQGQQHADTCRCGSALTPDAAFCSKCGSARKGSKAHLASMVPIGTGVGQGTALFMAPFSSTPSDNPDVSGGQGRQAPDSNALHQPRGTPRRPLSMGAAEAVLKVGTLSPPPARAAANLVQKAEHLHENRDPVQEGVADSVQENHGQGLGMNDMHASSMCRSNETHRLNESFDRTGSAGATAVAAQKTGCFPEDARDPLQEKCAGSSLGAASLLPQGLHPRLSDTRTASPLMRRMCETRRMTDSLDQIGVSSSGPVRSLAPSLSLSALAAGSNGSCNRRFDSSGVGTMSSSNLMPAVALGSSSVANLLSAQSQPHHEARGGVEANSIDARNSHNPAAHISVGSGVLAQSSHPILRGSSSASSLLGSGMHSASQGTSGVISCEGPNLNIIGPRAGSAAAGLRLAPTAPTSSHVHPQQVRPISPKSSVSQLARKSPSPPRTPAHPSPSVSRTAISWSSTRGNAYVTLDASDEPDEGGAWTAGRRHEVSAQASTAQLQTQTVPSQTIIGVVGSTPRHAVVAEAPSHWSSAGASEAAGRQAATELADIKRRVYHASFAAKLQDCAPPMPNLGGTGGAGVGPAASGRASGGAHGGSGSSSVANEAPLVAGDSVASGSRSAAGGTVVTVTNCDEQPQASTQQANAGLTPGLPSLPTFSASSAAMPSHLSSPQKASNSLPPSRGGSRTSSPQKASNSLPPSRGGSRASSPQKATPLSAAVPPVAAQIAQSSSSRSGRVGLLGSDVAGPGGHVDASPAHGSGEFE